jgi:hypothetical protein
MADKKKVKWYDTFNPFARKQVADDNKKAADAAKKRKRKTIKIDWDKRIKQQEAAKAAARKTVNPTTQKPKKSTVKVVKPKPKKKGY